MINIRGIPKQWFTSGMWSQWPAFAPYNFLRNQNFKESLWVHISKNKRPTEWDKSGALYVPTNYRNRKRQKEAQPTTKYSFFERLFSSLQLDWKNRIGARCWISGVTHHVYKQQACRCLSYMIPKCVWKVHQLYRNANGKTNELE